MEERNIISGKVGPKKGEGNFTRTDYDVVVYIPKFYYKVIDNSAESKRYFYIADKIRGDFNLHPGSNRYLSKYHAADISSGIFSRTGRPPFVDQKLDIYRQRVKQKESGWQLYDFQTHCALLLLYLIEFADWDAQQKIGYGKVYSSSTSYIKANSGGSNSAVYHTARMSGSVSDDNQFIVYRNIENPFGNVGMLLDGIIVANNELYYCSDPSKYKETTSLSYITSNYTYIGTRISSSGFCKSLEFVSEEPWIFLPKTTGGSATTYIPDKIESNGSDGFFLVSLFHPYSSTEPGMFSYKFNIGQTTGNQFMTVRLVFVPPEDASN